MFMRGSMTGRVGYPRLTARAEPRGSCQRVRAEPRRSCQRASARPLLSDASWRLARGWSPGLDAEREVDLLAARGEAPGVGGAGGLAGAMVVDQPEALETTEQLRYLPLVSHFGAVGDLT